MTVQVNVHLIHDESNLVTTLNPFPSEYAVRRLRAVHAILEAMVDPTAVVFGFVDIQYNVCYQVSFILYLIQLLCHVTEILIFGWI